MRIVIDLDGVICTLKKPDETYSEVQLIPGAVEKLNHLRKEGHYIIIQTARNMATCDSNLGKVMRNVGQVTFEWLSRHEVPYDEIYFGKPNANIYIDDRGFRFEDWKSIDTSVLEKISREK